MIRLALLGFLAILFASASAAAQTCSVPNTLVNNTTADATQVMGNFNALVTCFNALATQAIPPQGRLTLTSGTPVMTSDVTGATTVYYTPYIGALVPIYSATTSKFTMYPFTQLSAVLSSTTQTANNVYDVFIFLNSGTTVTIGFGPSWTTGTAGSNQQRGTGAGSTAISQINGIWTNSNVITLANSTSSYPSIPAGQATYVGTIATLPATAGQTSMQFKPTPAVGGTANFLGVYNAYNRVSTIAECRDSQTSWNYATTSTWRKADNNANNAITYIDGLGASMVEAKYLVSIGTSSSTAEPLTGVNFDSTSATPVGVAPLGYVTPNSIIQLMARDQLTALGLHYVQAMEFTSANTPVFYGAVISTQNEGLALRIEM